MYVAPAPTIGEMLGKLRPERAIEILSSARDPREDEYPHWDKIRQLEPPPGLSDLEWWWAIKLRRRFNLRPIPRMKSTTDQPFEYAMTDVVARSLRYVDQHCSGEVAMEEVVTADEQARHRYLVNSLMEEAIRSSQLEGAVTSRGVAKEMLASGRDATDRSERMILNNYRALQYMREMGQALTPAVVLELQRILTDGTLDNPDAAGRLQRPDEERIAVLDRTDGTVIHTPPPAEQLPARLAAMCDFANEDVEAGPFMHPVVRAIVLHLWLAYDHPFEDGNGRTARALFYWYMRTHGYWLVEYLSISKILREAPSKYTRAYLLTETDGFDATYFIHYQLDVIERAVEQLRVYLQSKVREVKSVERVLRGGRQFNHRQLALLSDALRSPDTAYTFAAHAKSNGVTHETARNDLLPLVDLGLLDRTRRGRRFLFTASPDLSGRLEKIGANEGG